MKVTCHLAMIEDITSQFSHSPKAELQGGNDGGIDVIDGSWWDRGIYGDSDQVHVGCQIWQSQRFGKNHVPVRIQNIGLVTMDTLDSVDA